MARIITISMILILFFGDFIFSQQTNNYLQFDSINHHESNFTLHSDSQFNEGATNNRTSNLLGLSMNTDKSLKRTSLDNYLFLKGVSENGFREKRKESLTHSKSNRNIVSSDSISNNHSDDLAFWLSVGLGNSYFGPLLLGDFTIRSKANLFTIRYLSAAEFRFSPGGYEYDDPELNLNEVGILYGRYFKKDITTLFASGGIGYITGVDRGEKITEKKFQKVKLSSFGLAIKVAFKIDITKFFGFGISFVSNINTQKNLYSGVFQIYIGKL